MSSNDLRASTAEALDTPQTTENIAPRSLDVRKDDLKSALSLPPYWEDQDASVYILPDSPWVHRLPNCLDAVLEHLQPDHANAVLRPNGNAHFDAKIRAKRKAMPIASSRLWMIERLPAAEVDHFIQAFSACRWGDLRSPVFRAWR